MKKIRNKKLKTAVRENNEFVVCKKMQSKHCTPKKKFSKKLPKTF